MSFPALMKCIFDVHFILFEKYETEKSYRLKLLTHRNILLLVQI